MKRRTDTQRAASACSVLVITPDGQHDYGWAASMIVALEVMDPFSECAYLRRYFVTRCENS